MSGKFNEKDKSISCSVCQRCGACDYIKVPYEKELSEKKNYINKLFKGICTFDKVNGMYRPAFYRNKVHAVVGLDRDKNIITGTYEEGTHNIIAVDECRIEDSKADEIMATSESMLGQANNISKNSGQVEISAKELAASAEQLSNQVQQFHI